MGMVTEPEDRISVRKLTKAYAANEISTEELMRTLQESYSFHEQIEVISSPKPGVLTISYNADTHPRLHKKLKAAGWETDGIVIDAYQTPESVERTQPGRVATYRLGNKSKNRMTIFRG